jgi:stearoyl-CoA desaturase (delta-9 desaturase)
VKLKTDNVYGFLTIHLLAGLAVFPWFFSWAGLWLLVAGLFVFGVFGINLCFHRLLTHRSFSCPLWLEHVLATLAVCSVQDSPPHWVAVHRRHHEFADEDHDPHSPLAGFFWSHMGWLCVKLDDMSRRPLIERYARDIIRDPYYLWLEWRGNWIKVALLSWLAFFMAGFAYVVLTGGALPEAMRFGFSLVIWGGALRTVIVWHITWSVNSVTHVWGYRNYNTPDVSRNNALIAFLTSGEGWHNNHHADSRSARHGHKWWEIDVTWMLIRLLMGLGLARNVALPSPILAAKFNGPGAQPAPRPVPPARAAEVVSDSDIALAPALPPVRSGKAD